MERDTIGRTRREGLERHDHDHSQPGALRLLGTDVLVYIVVLNLFVEWAPAVVIESVTISIFTAIALKPSST